MTLFLTFQLPFIVATCCKTFKAEILQIYPELDVNSRATFGVPNAISDIWAVIPMLWVELPVFPVTITVFVLRSRILKYLDRQENLSEQTKKMHRNLLKALTLQAFLPPLYPIGMNFFTIQLFFQIHHPVVEYGLYFISGWVPILAPLFPLYFVASYRRFLVHLFTNKVNYVGSSNNTASFGATNSSQRSLVVRY